MKKFWILPLLLFLAIVLVNQAESAPGVTLNYPANGTVISGIIGFNITTIMDGSVDNGTTNITIYYQVNNSGTWNLLTTLVNSSANQTYWNRSYNWTTTGVTDGNITIIVTTKHHNSVVAIEGNESYKYIAIDNSNPITTYGTGTPTDNKQLLDNTTLRIDTSTDNSYASCTLYWTRLDTSSTTKYAVSPSSGVCSQEVNGTDDEDYEYYWIVTDAYDSAKFTTRTIKFSTSKGVDLTTTTKDTSSALISSQGNFITNNLMLIIIISIAGVLIIVGLFYSYFKFVR